MASSEPEFRAAKLTPREQAARWMLDAVGRSGYLHQSDAASEVARFGEALIYTNENGNPAIDRKVLAEFRRICEDSVVWSRSERAWRLRDDGDEPGRGQE